MMFQTSVSLFSTHKLESEVDPGSQGGGSRARGPSGIKWSDPQDGQGEGSDRLHAEGKAGLAVGCCPSPCT